MKATVVEHNKADTQKIFMMVSIELNPENDYENFLRESEMDLRKRTCKTFSFKTFAYSENLVKRVVALRCCRRRCRQRIASARDGRTTYVTPVKTD